MNTDLRMDPHDVVGLQLIEHDHPCGELCVPCAQARNAFPHANEGDLIRRNRVENDADHKYFCDDCGKALA